MAAKLRKNEVTLIPLNYGKSTLFSRNTKKEKMELEWFSSFNKKSSVFD